MSRRFLVPIITLTFVGCAVSSSYSRPGVHPYTELPVLPEEPGSDETEPPPKPTAKPQAQLEAPDPLRDQCRETREARQSDRLRAQRALEQYHAEQGRVMPWYSQHCRLAEIMVTRKVGDGFESTPEQRIECDTEEGRPRGLTEEFVAEHEAVITTPDQFYSEDLRELHYACSVYDAREPR
jgi:hypothetical protein